MRRDGWERLLADYVAAAMTKPFAWGSHDCALWAASWVRECTGQDHAAEWFGQYRSGAGALRAIRARGLAGVADIADRHLDEIPVRQAGRGDLVLHPQDALGICLGLRSYFVTETGLVAEPTLACGRAWKVG